MLLRRCCVGSCRRVNEMVCTVWLVRQLPGRLRRPRPCRYPPLCFSWSRAPQLRVDRTPYTPWWQYIACQDQGVIFCTPPLLHPKTSLSATLHPGPAETPLLSCDIHTRTPARATCTNFELYPFVLQSCSTYCLGHGHGYECHSPSPLPYISYIYIYTILYIHIYIYIHIHTCMYVYIYIYIHIHIYTNIYIYDSNININNIIYTYRLYLYCYILV